MIWPAVRRRTGRYVWRCRTCRAVYVDRVAHERQTGHAGYDDHVTVPPRTAPRAYWRTRSR
jgi:hypothetical protein